MHHTCTSKGCDVPKHVMMSATNASLQNVHCSKIVGPTVLVEADWQNGVVSVHLLRCVAVKQTCCARRIMKNSINNRLANA